MKNLQHKQDGFSAVEILMVVVAVGIVAFASFYVYRAQKNTDSTLKSTNGTVANDSMPKTTKVVAPNDTQVLNGYLVFKEWGVEMPLSSDISDAYYVKSTVDNNYQNMDLGTRSLLELDKGCAADSVSFMYMGRETAAIHDKNASMDPEWNRPVYSTKIGNYYYGFIGPQATCSDKESTNQKQAATATAYAQAAKGLKAIQ